MVLNLSMQARSPVVLVHFPDISDLRMKRRNFCRYVALSSACDALVVGRSSSYAMIHNSSQYRTHHRWVVLYWMPYDNDLSSFGEPIIEMLARGTKNSEAVVVVQSHYFGDHKMRRRVLSNGVTREIDIAAEDSSNIFVRACNYKCFNLQSRHFETRIICNYNFS